LLRAVDRLPWPWYATYATVFILGQAAIAGLRADAQAGWAQRFLEPPRVFWLWSVYLPAFTHYLGRVAREKLLRFREVLGLDDDAFRALAYRLYTLCERQGWAEDARAYNELVAAWGSIEAAAAESGPVGTQTTMDY